MAARKFQTVEEITKAFVKKGWAEDTRFTELTLEKAQEKGFCSIADQMAKGRKFFTMDGTESEYNGVGNVYNDMGKIVWFDIPTIRQKEAVKALTDYTKAKTRFVWTRKAQDESVNTGETRAAGFPAVFASEPLEKNPTIGKKWLLDGYVEYTDTPLPFLQFYWKGDNTCASEHMINTFKKNGICHERNAFGQLMADIGKGMVPVEYYHVEGNLYGITEKPRSTSSYFGISPVELYKKNSDGYTKEEALLCDSNIHAKPFCPTLYNAVRKAADYVQLGCEGVEILQMLNNKYAVVSY